MSDQWYACKGGCGVSLPTGAEWTCTDCELKARADAAERERDELRAKLHDTESRLRDALALARNYGMQAEEQGRWWRETKAKLQAAEERIQELQRETARHRPCFVQPGDRDAD